MIDRIPIAAGRFMLGYYAGREVQRKAAVQAPPADTTAPPTTPIPPAAKAKTGRRPAAVPGKRPPG